ncbi:MAG: DUF1080 domain-containing protein [Candidatus Sumerlaeota bacterium]|nr:DUF1080 domain-containing protein [Candidatus Sumerlaeota bacterium]
MKETILPVLFCIALVQAQAVLAADEKSKDQARVEVHNANPSDYQPKLDKDGWEILFDGKNLDAWQGDPKDGVWAINEQGELTPVKSGRNLFTKQRYCDYVIELDFKVAANKKSNSGVMFRVHDLKNPVNTGMEIQILDNAAYGAKWDAMNANGALYDLVHPSENANSPLGEWNHFKITANDNLVTVELNGKKIVKSDLNQWTTANQNPDGKHNKFPYPIASLPREGFIGLQNYGGAAVWFRNVRIKALTDRKPQYTGKEPIADVLKKVEPK